MITVTNLVIKTTTKKLAYVEGDLFDADGLVLTATMSDGTVKDVNDGFTVDKKAGLTLEDTTVVVTYLEKSVNISITVAKRTDITISALATYRMEAEDLNTGNAALREDFITDGRTFIEEGVGASNGKNLVDINQVRILQSIFIVKKMPQFISLLECLILKPIMY